jgi:2-amino-4-hydroxy-6-hydroxymethyldihydropteridine diphosphokinase
LSVSRAYETEPVGCTDQATFLNAAVLLETSLTPEDLKLKAIDRIEAELGRVRDPLDKNAPRTIDIDISLWNNAVIEVSGRPVPDPDILRFAHVAVPLAEIAPDYVHPVSGETLAQIARRLLADSNAPRPRLDLSLGPRIQDKWD